MPCEDCGESHAIAISHQVAALVKCAGKQQQREIRRELLS